MTFARLSQECMELSYPIVTKTAPDACREALDRYSKIYECRLELYKVDNRITRMRRRDKSDDAIAALLASKERAERKFKALSDAYASSQPDDVKEAVEHARRVQEYLALFVLMLPEEPAEEEQDDESSYIRIDLDVKTNIFGFALNANCFVPTKHTYERDSIRSHALARRGELSKINKPSALEVKSMRTLGVSLLFTRVSKKSKRRNVLHIGDDGRDYLISD